MHTPPAPDRANDATPTDWHEIGRLAYRRNQQCAPILDPAVVAACNALPPEERRLGPGVDTEAARIYQAWNEGWTAARDGGEPRTDEEPTPTLTITHTSADGTLLTGSRKGDGAWEAIKAAQKTYRISGWRYMPSIRMVGVHHSRDDAPRLGLIDRTAEVLREAGFQVEVEIDGTPRRMEDAELDRELRMGDRADALRVKSARKASEADDRYEAAQQISERFAGGQPILRGHHSERGARRDKARMDGHMRASIELAEEAKTAHHRAVTSEHHMEARNNPRRVYRRIRTLEADLRKAQRELTPCRLSGRKLKPEAAGRTLTCPACYHDYTVGEDLLFPEHGAATGRRREEVELRVAHLEEQIRYWRQALAEAKADGADVPPDTDAIQKGYWVKSWAGWCEVTRVNKISVTVLRSSSNYADHQERFYSQKITLDDIREIREHSPFKPVPEPAPADHMAAVDLDALQAATEVETPPAPARHPSGLPDAVLEELRLAGATETSVHLARTPTARDVYAQVDTALSRLPGFRGYDTHERAYMYRRDPRPALRDLTGVDPIRPASGGADKALSYYRTPDHLARLMAAELGVAPGDRVLEPSAGDGALVKAVRLFRPEVAIAAVELDQVRTRILCRTYAPGSGVTVYAQTRFQDFTAGWQRDGGDLFDGVIMNPPFTETGDRQAWATHFLLAWDLLKPGRRMVAVLPASYRYAKTQAAGLVRELVESSHGVVDDLNAETFKNAGTGVSTVLVTVTKQAQEPDSSDEPGTAAQPATAQEALS